MIRFKTKNMLLDRQSYFAGRALFFLLGPVCFFLALCALAIPMIASADTNTQSAYIQLQDNKEVYHLGSYIHVRHWPGDQDISHRMMRDHFHAGLRGQLNGHGLVYLGFDHEQHILSLTVENVSWREDWILSFGNHSDGRWGEIEELYVVNMQTNEIIIDTISIDKNPYRPYIGSGYIFQNLQIPKGETVSLLIIAKKDAGVITSLNPVLYSPQSYNDKRSSFWASGAWLTTLLLSIGILCLVLSTLNRFLFGVFAAALMGMFIFLFNTNDEIFFSEKAVDTSIIYSVFALSGIMTSVLVYSFFNRFLINKIFNKYIIFLGIICALGLAAFHVAGIVNSNFSWLFIFIPLAFTSLLLTIISSTQLFNRISGAGFLTAFLLFNTAGYFCFLLFAGRLMPPEPWVSNLIWYLMAPQALCLLGAKWMPYMNELQSQNALEFQAEDKALQFKLLKESKVLRENNSLQRMYNHEKEMMNEMREREMQQSEEMRQAKIAADEANSAKSAFLAVVSHEIRTPMMGIMGMVRLLDESQLNKDQKEYTQTIQESGEAMVALLNDILDFEKIESGKMDLEQVSFDLDRLLKGIVTLMKGHAATKNIYLRLETPHDLPRFVIGDPVRLRQVLLNLIGNAIKFTSEGGVTVLIKDINAEHYTESKFRDNFRLEFSVIDTGVGISESAKANLFNPFAQADSSISRKYGGTGLGLVISQRLITAMGGNIELESEENKGSRFYFTLILPRADKAEDTRVSADPIQVGKTEHTMSVLVVEDNHVNQKLMNEFLSRMGQSIKIASSGEDALQLVANEEFDLIFMDISLPGISGIETTIRLRNDRNIKQIPIYALTGNVLEEDIRKCYDAGMNGHIAKPVSPDALRHAINEGAKHSQENKEPDDNSDLLQKSDKDNAGSREEKDHQTEAEPRIDTDNEENAIHPPEQDEKPDLEKPDNAGSAEEDVSEQEETLTATDYDNGAAPIKDFIANMEDMDFDDDELDEDTFSSAIEQLEQEEKEPEALELTLEGDDSSGAIQSDVFHDQTLSDLKKTMSRGDMADMIGELLDKTDEIIKVLTATEKPRAPDRHDKIHELKGMAANFGLHEIREICGQIEKDVSSGQEAQADAAIQKLPEAAKRARAALQEWLES